MDKIYSDELLYWHKYPNDTEYDYYLLSAGGHDLSTYSSIIELCSIPTGNSESFIFDDRKYEYEIGKHGQQRYSYGYDTYIEREAAESSSRPDNNRAVINRFILIHKNGT